MTSQADNFVGWQVVLETTTYIVEECSQLLNCAVLKDSEGNLREITIDDFRGLHALGLVTNPSAQSSLTRQLATPEENNEAAFKEMVLRRVEELKRRGHTWNKILTKLEADFEFHSLHLRRQKCFPSKRTIQGWRTEYLMKGKVALKPKWRNSGNRTARYDFEFQEVVLDLLEKHFVNNDLKSITWIARQATRIYLAQCREQEKIPGPHGRKSVEAIVYALPHAGLLKSRLGDEEARSRYLAALRYQEVATPLERVELDCTRLDIWCVDDNHKPIGRPNVCVAIDCATGVILGLQLSWSSPNAALVSRTVREMLEPKTEEFFLRHGIENRFQAFGLPSLLITDQGSENSGDVLCAIISSTSLEWRKMIPGRPDKKPYVERFNLELSRFVTEFPGASQTALIGPRDRTDKAKQEAIFTMREVETLLQRWRYDVYARKMRRRVQNVLRTKESPMKSWQRLSQETFIPLPPDPHELRQMFMVQQAIRTGQRYGVQYGGVTYHSPELAMYLKRVGVPAELEIRVDPNDIREIAVWNYLDREHFFVPAKYDECPALSFDELARIRKSLITEEDQELEEMALITAMHLHLYEEKPKAKTPTAASREKAAKEARRREMLDQSRRAMESKGHIGSEFSNEKPSFRMPEALPFFLDKGGRRT